jgi:ferredoxin-type protein NapG
MKRRNFLQKLILAASTFSVASVPYVVARMLAPNEVKEFSNHLRPPGALKDEDAFVKACIGCGLCGEVCPPKCIAFDKRQGGEAVNAPYINPENKACILCMKCVDVCPTEALTSLTREEVKMGIAQIDRSACYPWVDRGVCGACVAICPLGQKAIAFEFANMYKPYIKEEGCVGCGMCVEICPHPSLPIRIVEPGKGSIVQHSV